MGDLCIDTAQSLQRGPARRQAAFGFRVCIQTILFGMAGEDLVHPNTQNVKRSVLKIPGCRSALGRVSRV